jgi:SPP1 gp7 family putative phage head morphogenesis protein
MIDAEFAFALDLLRLDANTRAKIIAIMAEMQKELVGIVANSGDLAEIDRAKKLIAESTAAMHAYFDDMAAELTVVTSAAATTTASVTASILNTLTPVSIGVSLPVASHLKEIAKNSIIQGATQKEWWARQERDVAFKFAAAVRQGLVSAETNSQIINRVKDVMSITSSNAAALVQTSVQTVANNARMAVFEENSELIDRYTWATALDGHVCKICAARADLSWTVEDKKPIGHSIPWSVPPIHFNDRCIMRGVPKKWRDLGFDVDEPPEGQRASTNGPVPASTTFAQFLDRQSKEFQDETLGKGRADLWRSGKITLQDLINGNGKPLTVEQLQKKYE